MMVCVDDDYFVDDGDEVVVVVYDYVEDDADVCGDHGDVEVVYAYDL